MEKAAASRPYKKEYEIDESNKNNSTTYFKQELIILSFIFIICFSNESIFKDYASLYNRLRNTYLEQTILVNNSFNFFYQLSTLTEYRQNAQNLS